MVAHTISAAFVVNATTAVSIKSSNFCSVKMNSKQILCEHVNRLLRERNITKSELAEGIDMDKSNLGKMLNGQHPFDLNLLDPIAEFFGVDCKELIRTEKEDGIIRYTDKDTTIIAIRTNKYITDNILQQIAKIL